MDHPRVSEKVEKRNGDTEGGDRHDQETAEEAEDDILGDVYFSSGSNLWRDSNHPNPDLRQAKATLAAWIIRALNEQNLSTREAEAKTGIAHSEFSRIRNTKLTRFTLDRLFLIYNRLEPDKEVVLELKEPVPGVWKRWDERGKE